MVHISKGIIIQVKMNTIFQSLILIVSVIKSCIKEKNSTFTLLYQEHIV